MPIPATESGIAPAAKEFAAHANTLVRLEIELAAIELRRKAAGLGVGIGLGAGTVVLALYALGFGLLAAAAGLATLVATWLALLIVTTALVVLAAVCGLLAQHIVRAEAPPLPEEAILEARLTSDALRRNGR